ncbi:hypothetical protein Btru_000641 [Bulinus truncatus]|nr:hypothetical protein Btru_000641 [Bulinus truncatus]
MLPIVYLCVLTTLVSGFQVYQTFIPNGDVIPNPCLIGMTWAGAGHFSAIGAGPLNQFGQDFAAAGHVWNDALCNKDSDNDGKSNGEELGDPHCHFTPAKPGHLVNPTGHPGICEPVGSPACAWQAFTC